MTIFVNSHKCPYTITTKLFLYMSLIIITQQGYTNVSDSSRAPPSPKRTQSVLLRLPFAHQVLKSCPTHESSIFTKEQLHPREKRGDSLWLCLQLRENKTTPGFQIMPQSLHAGEWKLSILMACLCLCHVVLQITPLCKSHWLWLVVPGIWNSSSSSCGANT